MFDEAKKSEEITVLDNGLTAKFEDGYDNRIIVCKTT